MTLPDPLRGLGDEMRQKLEERAFPDWVDPMLATLVHESFSDPEWIYERKLDGERCLAFVRGSEVRLLSRNRKQLNDTYPELEEALAGQGSADMILDGEIVAFEEDVTSFSRLQNRMQIKERDEARRSRVTVYFYLFDIMQLGDTSLEKLPLKARKQVLREALRFEDPLRFTSHRLEEGEAYHEEACRKGWEGVIAKQGASSYAHSRSRNWLKFKCVNRQEFVIVGYTDPEGERVGFGALLIGYHQGDRLRYAGKVGTGYDDDFLEQFGSKLEAVERKTPPVDEADDDLPSSGVHWVTPTYVGEVGFTEWTGDGKLRHPRFLGLRRDKDPDEVVREG
jgi:DNA ligase D-like protein (predicted ligase)